MKTILALLSLTLSLALHAAKAPPRLPVPAYLPITGGQVKTESKGSLTLNFSELKVSPKCPPPAWWSSKWSSSKPKRFLAPSDSRWMPAAAESGARPMEMILFNDPSIPGATIIGVKVYQLAGEVLLIDYTQMFGSPTVWQQFTPPAGPLAETQWIAYEYTIPTSQTPVQLYIRVNTMPANQVPTLLFTR